MPEKYVIIVRDAGQFESSRIFNDAATKNPYVFTEAELENAEDLAQELEETDDDILVMVEPLEQHTQTPFYFGLDDEFDQGELSLQFHSSELSNQDREQIREHNWIIHYVHGDIIFMASIHTHGLLEYLNHPDLEICLSMPQKAASVVFKTLVREIDNGTRLEENTIYSDLLPDVTFKVVKRTESDRQVLRLIFADNAGKFPGDEGCEPYYDRQLEKYPYLSEEGS